MQTFVAEFVRPSGERGVMYIMAKSSTQALIHLVDREGAVARANVYPRRRAALLCAPPLLRGRDRQDGLAGIPDV